MPKPSNMEQVVEPLYDTQEIGPRDVISFFQNPGRRGEDQTNVQTAGALSWPLRFDVTALALRFGADVPAGKLGVEFWIGEERVLSEELKTPGNLPAHAFDWPIMVEIPSLQNFRVILRSHEDTGSRKPIAIRCNLLGTLHREKRT